MDIVPSRAQFLRLAKHATVIPVWTELLADLETPVSTFLKLDDGHTSFLLESVEGQEKVARFSFVGSAPKLLFSSRGRAITLATRMAGGRMREQRYHTEHDPLWELERLMRPFRHAPVPQLPRFSGGLVGYLGYDVVRCIEHLPPHRVDTLRVPDIMLMLSDSMVIFDHARHNMLLVVNAFTKEQSPTAAYRDSVERLAAMITRLRQPINQAAMRARRRRALTTPTRSNMSKAEFIRMVKRAKEDIRAGEIIQVVLSQRFERVVACDPLGVYRALRSLNPSPYMYYLRFGDMSVVGSSPEMLVRCEDGVIETRPIAGTRPRGANEQEDERLMQQLLRSPKERAEHLMLIDLGRNDLGRVARVGSMTTPELMAIEKYSHVMHLVSSVRGRLQPNTSAFDVLRATFPAGTVTGAPKVRAMEIIAQLERERRGPYAGAVGYLSFSGNLDTCITIRTLLMHQGRASVQAGAGIVADSDPQREYQETVNKAQGCLEAIDMAQRRGFS